VFFFISIFYVIEKLKTRIQLVIINVKNIKKNICVNNNNNNNNTFCEKKQKRIIKRKAENSSLLFLDNFDLCLNLVEN
jgi:hypothetical protein